MESDRWRIALALRQFADDVIRALLEHGVAGAGIHQRQRREIMAETVAAQLAFRLLPAAERLRARRQADVHPEGVQQPVGIETQQISLIPQHRIAERPVEQAHVRQGKRLRRPRDFHHCRISRCHPGAGQKTGERNADYGRGKSHDYLVCSRSTVKEFPGNERLRFVPLNSTASVFGETFVGFSSEFSSAPLSEVSPMAVTLPVRFFAPARLISVSSGFALALTIFTITSPDFSSLTATA